LFIEPALVPVTLIENVQLVLAASVAPDSDTPLPPAAAVMVPPPHDPASPFGVATVSPLGRGSVKPTFDSDVPEFGFVTVNVSDVDPPVGIVAAPNDFEIDGGAVDPDARIISDPLAVEPVPPLPELTAPDVLFAVPGVLLVTSNDIVHVEPGSLMVAPETETVDAPALAVVDEKRQPSVKLGGFATVMPAGKVSLIATFVSGTEFELGLPNVNVRVDVPPAAIVDGAKALETVGGPTTASVAFAGLPLPPSVDVTLVV
jgi:hypothetical protein